MTTTLLNLPEPRPSESVQGFLLRLAEANACPTVEWLQRVDGLDAHLRALVGTSIFGFVPKWLGIFEVPAAVPPAFEQKFCLGRRARCCVACALAAPYWRAIWEHRLYVACHVHSLELVDTCPNCGIELCWKRAAILRCPCGSEITSWKQVEANHASVDAAQHIWRAFVGATGALQDIAVSQTSAVDELSFSSIAALISHLGATTDTTEYMLSPKAWRNLSLSETLRLISAAYSRLTDWPIKFHEFLREEDQSVANAAVISPRLRRLKRFLFHDLSPDLTFLLDGFRAYMREQSMDTLDRRRHWATIGDIESQAYVAATAAARQLGIRAATLHTLATRVGVTEIKRRGGIRRHFTLIKRTALASIKQELSAEISLRNISLLLGVSTSRVEQLADAGLLKRRTVTHGLVSTSFFRRCDALELVASLKKGGYVITHPDCEISFTEVCKYYLAQRAEFISLIRAVQEQRMNLRRWNESARGMAGAIFGRGEFLNWHRQQCCIGGMTVSEAAAHLHVKQEVAYHFVKSGLLKGRVAVRGRRSVTLITSDALSDFEQRYISSAELAAGASLPVRKVVAVLFDLGVSPICGPQTDGSRQNIFRRRDVELVSEAFKAAANGREESDNRELPLELLDLQTARGKA
ncbi:Helix-turn-helix domain protein [Caballeronia fortuita]|uniref:Helix-turn-helix domain protein n=1 Tax=Caballeronia fortuita TaxID=1777138 RepID=A0A157Z5N2_9BURK|nr:hypothetical protein [Caballeronia fortuita]SAK40850.1 Helix-turn-helix domain protein [Caballeronia fortuita]